MGALQQSLYARFDEFENSSFARHLPRVIRNYKAPKQARIRDLKLGLLNFSFKCLIFAYIIIYKIGIQQHYLEMVTPQVIARTTLMQPFDRPYPCNPLLEDCDDSIPPIQTLPYCCNASCTYLPSVDDVCDCPWRPFKNYNCRYSDGLDARLGTGNDLFITTWESNGSQWFNASYSGTGNVWPTQGKRQQRFIAGIDEYTVLVEHSLHLQRGTSYSRTSREMGGSSMIHIAIEDSITDRICRNNPNATSDWRDGSSKTDKAPCFIPTSRLQAGSVFKISDLLAYANASFDGPSYAGSNHSMRFEGLAMSMNIKYYNRDPSIWEVFTGLLGFKQDRLHTIDHVFSFSAIKQFPQKRKEFIWNPFPTNRTVTSKHGVYVHIFADGYISFVNSNNVLVCITTSLTLLAVAKLIVDLIATQVLYHKDLYRTILAPTVLNRRQLRLKCDISDLKWKQDPTLNISEQEAVGAVRCCSSLFGDD